MRPSSRQRIGSLTSRYQTPQRSPQRFSKEIYLQRRSKQFNFDLNTSLLIENKNIKKYLKPTIHISQLQTRLNKYNYLPLHYFEDTLNDHYSNDDLFQKIKKEGPIIAYILTNQNEFQEGKIFDYDQQNQQFHYQISDQFGEAYRLFFVCEFENIKMYIQKFEKALKDREIMDNLLRYNYYIENMQTQDIPQLSYESIKRIQNLIGQNIPNHVTQINIHYKKVQNQLQFNNYIKSNKDMIKFQLIVDQNKEQIPEFGKLQLQFQEIKIVHKDFIDYQPISYQLIKKQFQEVTLFTMPELIESMHQINILNNQIQQLELLFWDNKPYSILQLKEKQDSLVSKSFKLINKWSEMILNIMRECLKSLEQKGILFPQYRLKRIIQVIRIKQIDCLNKLIIDNVNNFMQKYQNINSIIYHISIGYFGEFQYSFPVLEIINIYTNSFENQLLELSKIRDPECIMNISDLMYLPCISYQNEQIQCFVQNFKDWIKIQDEKLKTHLNQYFKYQSIFEWKLEDFVEYCRQDDTFNLQIFKSQIDKLQQLQLKLTSEIALSNQISIFLIDNSHLLFQINQLLESNVQNIMDYVSNLAITEVKETTLQFQKLQLQIKKQPNEIIGLENQRIYLQVGVYLHINELQNSIDKALKIYDVLDELSFISPPDQMKERWNLLSFINICKQNINECLDELMEKRIQQKHEFLQDLIHFKYQINDLERKVNSFIKNFNINQNKETTFMKDIMELKVQSELINEYEKIFNLPQTDFGKIDFIKQSLQPLENLTKLLKQWQNSSWMKQKLDELNVTEIIEFTAQSQKELKEILNYSTEKSMMAIKDLAQKMFDEILEFQPHLPIIIALTEPGMRQRHWTQLDQLVGEKIEYNERILEDLISIFSNFQIQLIQLSQTAKQELQIEITYTKVFNEYKSYTAQIMKPRPQLQSLQFNKLLNLESLSQKLDDSLCTINQLLQSKYHTPWKQELQQLENQMIISQTTVQLLDTMQQLMSYIQPVFLQNDLQKQLPIEVNRFKGVEKFWRVMSNEYASKCIYLFKQNQIEEQINKLQQIEKSLCNYVDKKREIFQRFHFLSNQQILKLQSKSTQPNEFIDQIFHFNYVELNEDGICSIQIKNKLGKVIEKMNIDTVNIYSKNVEDWLQELIQKMRKTLQQQLHSQTQCNQIKNLIKKIEWTVHLDDHFKNYEGDKNSLYKRLLTIDPESFEYQIQIRYYINQNNDLIVKFLDYTFIYDFEFLYTNNEFIETPQTDRFFVNIAFAIKQNFGAYIYGNSGKIETLKQFSENIGKYFIILNAEISNCQLLTHFCKGVSSTGAYMALTKCSEIKGELLSIFVQMVKVIYIGLRNTDNLVDFDGQTIRVNPTFAFFMVGGCTQNATDEIKYYFRPIYLQKICLTIVIDSFVEIYQIEDEVTQLKQFVQLYSSLRKNDISISKIRQVIQIAQQEGIYTALLMNFQEPDLIDLINQIWPNQINNKFSIEQLLISSNYVLIFGESLSGKSKLISTLKNSQRIYLQSLPIEEFFGTFDTEGTISQILNTIGNNALVIDCELNNQLIELFSPLIFLQQITFPNGKSIQSNNQIIFETITIKYISPNIITSIQLLYLNDIQIEIPQYAQHYICICGSYKSPISKNAQLQVYKLILEKIQGQSTPELEAVFAAIWAFGASLNIDQKSLINRHIKDLWQSYEGRIHDPLSYDNLFEYILEDNQFVISNDPIEKLIDIMPNILLFGPSGSGKSHYLRNPFQCNYNTTSLNIQSYLQKQLIKKRNYYYTIGNVYIDDIHLLNNNSIEFLRQLVDSRGYYKVNLMNFKLIASTQTLQSRLQRYFVCLYCEPFRLQTINKIFNGNEQVNLEQFTQIYKESQLFFEKHSRILQITLQDIVRAKQSQQPSQYLSTQIFHRINDENLKINWVKQIKNYQSNKTIQDQRNEMCELVQYEGNINLLNYLVELINQFPKNNKLIVYGSFGVGKKTICKKACQVSKRNHTSIESNESILLLDNPSLNQISYLINQTQQDMILIMTTEHLENMISKATFLYKFQFLHLSDWPEDVFNNEIGNIIYKYIKEKNYYTICPRFYTNFIQLQEKLAQEKEEKVRNRINELSNGLQLLYSAQQAINTMNQKLTQIRPILEEAAKDAQTFVKQLQAQQIIVKQAKDLILDDEKVAEEEQSKANNLQNICMEKVQQVNTELEQTLQEVQKIKKEHLVEIKSLLQPPKAVKVIFGGVVILLQDQMKYTGNQDDYFEIAKKHLLIDLKDFLETLKNYNKDNLKPNIIQQLEQKIINDPDFTLERAKQCSFAVKYLFSWVKAIYDYHKVYVETQPIRDELDESYKVLKEKTIHLEEKRREVHQVTEKLESLEMQLKEKQNVKNQLEQQIEDCQTKIKRSQKLIEGFKEEQKRWTTVIYSLKGEQTRNEGDSVLATSILIYGGPMTKEDRKQFYSFLYKQFRQLEIKFSEKCTLNSYFNDETDSFIEENAKILFNSKMPSILIDPQNLAKKYLKQKFENIKITNDLKKIHSLKQLKQDVIIDITGNYDLLSLDQNQIHITNEQNAKFEDVIYINYKIINYTITQDVLIEKFLQQLIENENPSLELKRQHNLELWEQDKRFIIQIENKILNYLQNQKSIDDLLSNEILINQLHNSKQVYEETIKKIDMANRLNEDINLSRDQYKLLAQQISSIYQTLSDLQKINPIYQYGLEWFLQQLTIQSKKIQRQNEIALNISQIKTQFYKGVINEVCQLLSEEDRLIFCFIIALDLLKQKGLTAQDEIDAFLCYKLSKLPKQFKAGCNPCIFIDDNEWPQIKSKLYFLNSLPAFEGILEQVEDHPIQFKQLYLHQQFNNEQQKLTSFQKFLLTFAFRPDKIIGMMINLIEQQLQLKYIFDKTSIDLLQYGGRTPLFILNGSKSMSKLSITLGESQFQKAEKLLKDSIENGFTLEFMNCQFGSKFLNTAEQIIEENEINENFKLILQTQQCSDFPIFWLNNSIKIAQYSSSNLIEILIQQLNQIDKFDHPHIFSLNLFQAIVNLRYKLGYCQYKFHEIDLQLMISQQHHFSKELIIFSQLPDEEFELYHTLYHKTVCQQSLREGFIYMGGELKMIKSDKMGYIKYLKEVGQVNDYNCIGLNSNSQIQIQNLMISNIVNKIQKIYVSDEKFIKLLDQIDKIERYTPVKLMDIQIENTYDLYYYTEKNNFNLLIDSINQTNKQLQQYIKGGQLNNEIEQIIQNLINDQVPQQWLEQSNIKQQSFNNWINKIFDKGTFLSKWNNLKCFNLNYISNPQHFLNLVKLDFTQKQQCSLENVLFKQIYLKEHHLEINKRPQNGVYLNGLKVQGGKLNEITQKMKALGHLEFQSDLPVIHLIPILKEDLQLGSVYQCPIKRENEVLLSLYFDSQDPLTLLQVEIKVL